MAIFSDKNLYAGVNAHLNSFLQSEGGGWESFHAQYVATLATELDRHLPPNYYALAEKSLQISEIGLSVEQSQRIRPDVSIYQTHPSVSSTSLSASATAPSLTLPLAEILEDEDDYLTGVVIYHVEGGKVPGKPVTRIEVLSPANKPPQAYYRQYLARRLQTLRGGLTLVEIDLLHESRPVIRKLASYPDNEENAYPYTVVVSDPHPTPEAGEVAVYGFGVDKTLPAVEIPLVRPETVLLDFSAVYNQVFESGRVYRMVVDYEQTPLNFDRYSPADQAIIRSVMERARQNRN